jgi:hypothetical protein
MNRVHIRQGLQYFIGGVIAASAIAKGIDLPGFARVLHTYQVFPEPLLFSLALTITLVELSLGLWILWGNQLRISVTVAAVMNVGYAGWMTVTLLRGLQLPNCGCFGVYFPRPLTWISPIEDLIFVGLCFALRALVQPSPK